MARGVCSPLNPLFFASAESYVPHLSLSALFYGAGIVWHKDWQGLRQATTAARVFFVAMCALCGNVRSLCVKDQCDLSAVPMSIFSVKKSINKSNNTPVSQKNTPVSHVSLPVSLPFRTSRSRFARLAPVSHVSLPFRSFFFFLIGVQTKNTIRKELRFVVWWSTARTLPCNAIPEPK